MSVFFQTATLDFQNFGYFDILSIIEEKILFSNNFGKFFNFQNAGIFVKGSFQVYMCTKFQVDMLKND